MKSTSSQLFGVAAFVVLSTAALPSEPASDTSTGDSVALEIESQVWIPLLTASNRFDAEGFLAVQSRDLVRIAPDAKLVYGLERYAAEIRAGFQRARQRGLQRTSELRFLARAHSDTLAHESGIFRSTSIVPGGGQRVRYSQFEMVLRKENGRWKLLVDKDTARRADGAELTEQDYLAASPLRSIAGATTR
jgi:ketosteroid isomerase-like protein